MLFLPHFKMVGNETLKNSSRLPASNLSNYSKVEASYKC